MSPAIQKLETITSINITSRSVQDKIPMAEVAKHDAPSNCWIIIYDRVYDVTLFLGEHPGGGDILLEYAGRDATSAFRGFTHSENAFNQLARFLIGMLPEEECLFRKDGGFRLTDLPE